MMEMAFITNKKRKKQIDFFVDKDHKVMRQYYDLLDSDLPPGKLLKCMHDLMEKDKKFYDPYLEAADIYFDKNEYEKGVNLLKNACIGAITTIVDAQGRWPKEMLWGFLENRHLMRAIERYGLYCWEENKIDEALYIFRNLLRVNPNDNQGMRYNILAIKMNLGFEEWQKPFEVKDDNGIVTGLNAFQVSEWFNKNVTKFPDEFDWLLKIYKEIYE